MSRFGTSSMFLELSQHWPVIILCRLQEVDSANSAVVLVASRSNSNSSMGEEIDMNPAISAEARRVMRFQGTQDTAASPGRGTQKRSGAIVQTLTPVTVRQLHLAQHTHPDDIFKVDDRELNQVRL